MAILNGSTVTSMTSTGLNRMHGSIYADYQVNTSPTQTVISGDLYVKGWKTTSGANFYGRVHTASTSVSASNGVATSSFIEQDLIVDQAAYEGYSSIGAFSITIPRLTVQQDVTFAISSSLTVYRATTTNTGESSGSISVSVPALQSYPVTYYNNDGTATSQTQTKYYGINLTLSPSQPAFAGYTFKGWATSAANAAAGTVTYSSGDTYSTNAALDLYAVWELTYSLPIINNLSVERCTQNGTLNDEGTYALVSFGWSIFASANARYFDSTGEYSGSTYPYNSTNQSVSSCTVTVGTRSATPTLTGTSGPKSVVVGNGSYDVDTQYNASVAITDTQSIVTPHTTTVTAVMSTANFPLDFNADGSAAGMFRPAPDNGHGLYVGDDVDIASGKKYKINGTPLSASDVGSVPTTRTVNSKALSSDITLTASDVSALPISGGTLSGGTQIFNCRIANSSSRETTASPAVTGKRGITSFLSSGTMTTDRPPSASGTGTGEGTIIHCEWDNTGGWNSQLFVADNDSNNGKPFVAVRGQRSGTWTDWDRLLAVSDKPKGYGTAVSLASYTSSSNQYSVPQDGLLKVVCTYRSNSYVIAYVNNTLMAEMASPSNANAAGNIATSIPVYKGQKVYINRSSTYSTVDFIPFTT